MDLSRMPNFSWHERQVLRASDDKCMFEEMFDNNDNNDKVQSPTSINSTTITTNNNDINNSNGDDLDSMDQKLLLRRGTYIDLTSGQKVMASLGKDRHFFETKIDYEGLKLPIRVPLTVNAEEVGDVSN